ncbi:MAG: energy transducer TonB [Ferruginibacter sp.]
MKKTIFLLCCFCILISVICKSQSYKFIYYLDADLATVAKSKATIMGKGFNEEKLFRLDCFAINGSDVLITLHFTDSSLAHLEGPYKNYHTNRSTEREGIFINDAEEGTWYNYDTLGRKTDSVFYKNGLAYATATYSYHKDGSLSYYTLKDSLQDTYQTVSYDEKNKVEGEVFFKGQKGILKTYNETGVGTDSLFTREESEASFPGGDIGWRQYLQKNLDANVPLDNKASAGKYTVIIKFVVTKDGTLKDIYAETYHGHGMELEVIRIIKNGPKWIPAVQYGRKVNAYRRQPVTFLVE